MTLHHPFTRPGFSGWTRRVRWRLGRRGPAAHVRGRSGLRGRAGPGTLVRRRYRRQLSRLERGLAADAPSLKSMFEMFNHLNEAEQPASVERVAPSGRPLGWPRPPAYVAVLLALAAVMTLCLTLGTRAHTVVRPCAAVSSASSVPALGGPVRGLNCSAYPTNK